MHDLRRKPIPISRPPDARTGGEDPKGEGVRGDSMLRPYLTLAGERPLAVARDGPFSVGS